MIAIGISLGLNLGIEMEANDDIAIIGRQEQELVLASFDENVAWQLGTWLRQKASERQLSIVIDIRRFVQPIFYFAMSGTSPDNPEWVRRKSNTVARFFRSSYGVGLELKEKGGSLQTNFALPEAEFAAHGGAFPIRVRDAGVIGCITVSGLPQRADHELVVEALCQFLGYDYEKYRLP
jgi:uncharacterized protein (UPF0303 family)